MKSYNNLGSLQVDKPKVTPVMQSTLRTNQRKTITKGRKPKKGKGSTKTKKGRKTAKSAPSAMGTSPSKARKIILGKNKLKRKKEAEAAVSEAPKKSPKTTSKLQEPKAKTRAVAVAKTSQKKKGAGVYQDRVDLGDGKWRYAVLENQVYGCANCRFIFGGCKICWKENFRGRSAAQVRSEMEAVTEAKAVAEDVGEGEVAETATSTSRGSKTKDRSVRPKVGKSKKVKTGKK